MTTNTMDTQGYFDEHTTTQAMDSLTKSFAGLMPPTPFDEPGQRSSSFYEEDLVSRLSVIPPLKTHKYEPSSRDPASIQQMVNGLREMMRAPDFIRSVYGIDAEVAPDHEIAGWLGKNSETTWESKIKHSSTVSSRSPSTPCSRLTDRTLSYTSDSPHTPISPSTELSATPEGDCIPEQHADLKRFFTEGNAIDAISSPVKPEPWTTDAWMQDYTPQKAQPTITFPRAQPVSPTRRVTRSTLSFSQPLPPPPIPARSHARPHAISPKDLRERLSTPPPTPPPTLPLPPLPANAQDPATRSQAVRALLAGPEKLKAKPSTRAKPASLRFDLSKDDDKAPTPPPKDRQRSLSRRRFRRQQEPTSPNRSANVGDRVRKPAHAKKHSDSALHAARALENKAMQPGPRSASRPAEAEAYHRRQNSISEHPNVPITPSTSAAPHFSRHVSTTSKYSLTPAVPAPVTTSQIQLDLTPFSPRQEPQHNDVTLEATPAIPNSKPGFFKRIFGR